MDDLETRLLLLGLDVSTTKDSNFLSAQLNGPDLAWLFYIRCRRHDGAYSVVVDIPESAEKETWAYSGHDIDVAWETLKTAWEEYHDQR